MLKVLTTYECSNLFFILGEIQTARLQWAGWNFVLLAVLIAATIALCLVVAWRRKQGRGAYQPRKLFISLCRAHQLDQAEQRLLALIAKSHELSQPSSIFLRPDLLSAEKLSVQFAAHRAQLESIRTRLFGASG